MHFLGYAFLAVLVGWVLMRAGIPMPRRRSALVDTLRRFLGCSPSSLPIVSRTFSTVDLPNLHQAITAHIKDAGVPLRVIGYTSEFGELRNSLRDMIARSNPFTEVCVGPVQYREVDVDVDRTLSCVESGIYLIEEKGAKLAAHVRFDGMRTRSLQVEVMAASQELAAAFLDDVRTRIARANIYRGKILSLECEAEAWGQQGCASIRFHRIPTVPRDAIILPAQTMALLDRNTAGFFRHAEALRRSGRSLKRGLLLHGKPGTGKTYTARWLSHALEGVTVILLSGEQLWLIKQCCEMARMLAPSLVILEDVDLIAAQRNEARHPMYQVTLHQLLNEMDGLASDAQVIFLLTTNRPESIEAALAGRPGRIDQAIEFPLPDAECRRRLLALYGRGLRLEVERMEFLVERLEGASPAFIQELIRKAALIAAEQAPNGAPEICVQDTHLDEALRELVLGGGDLTRNLLGFGDSQDAAASGPAPN